HIIFFDLLLATEGIKNPSAIENTHQTFLQIKQGNTSTKDLGGGMIGAAFVSVTYFLFDSLGTKILSFFLIVIGIILITGKSIGDVIGLTGKKLGAFIKNQWNSFLADWKEWQQERKAKKAEEVKQVQNPISNAR